MSSHPIVHIEIPATNAIDAAQESIYLETYIWKDDAPGQEFKEHLARKAAEGHGKMTKKLVFQA